MHPRMGSQHTRVLLMLRSTNNMSTLYMNCNIPLVASVSHADVSWIAMSSNGPHLFEHRHCLWNNIGCMIFQ